MQKQEIKPVQKAVVEVYNGGEEPFDVTVGEGVFGVVLVGEDGINTLAMGTTSVPQQYAVCEALRGLADRLEKKIPKFAMRELRKGDTGLRKAVAAQE